MLVKRRPLNTGRSAGFLIIWNFFEKTNNGRAIFAAGVMVIAGYIMTKPLLNMMDKLGESKTQNQAYKRLDKDSKIKFKDIVGGIPEEILDMSFAIRQASSFQRMKVRNPNGFLFVGPPGTGKTHLARAIAGELGCPFFAVNGSEFLSKWVGVGPKHVRDIFSSARSAATQSELKISIIFIDEIDAVGRRSDLDMTRTSSILSALLSEMDGFQRYPESHVIVIGATNEEKLLDSALKRAGRFDKRVPIPLPDEKKRDALLRHYLGLHPVESEVFQRTEVLEKVVRDTRGWNVPDLDVLVNDSARIAAKAASQQISSKHILMALTRILSGNHLQQI